MINEINTQIDYFLKKSPRLQSKFSIWHKGELYETSRGYEKSPLPDVFEIGSNGKTLTTTLLCILDGKGLLDINDKVGKFRPDLPFADEITLKQLASHTAGIPANLFKELHILLNPNTFQERTKSFKAEDLNEFLRNIKKPLKKGKFKYSNCGMALLGSILADCAGMPYEEAVRHYVLEPLGMSDTYLHWQHYSKDRLAIGHDKKGKPVEPFWWEGMEPAGVWRSTTTDMMLFLKAQLGYAGDNWKELASKATQATLNKSKGFNIGLGWVLHESKSIGTIAWHNGGTWGQTSCIAWSKEYDLAIVILTNQVPAFWHFMIRNRMIDELAVDLLETAAAVP